MGALCRPTILKFVGCFLQVNRVSYIGCSVFLKPGKTVFEHKPGPCHVIKAANEGSEDVAVLPDGRVRPNDIIASQVTHTRGILKIQVSCRRNQMEDQRR